MLRICAMQGSFPIHLPHQQVKVQCHVIYKYHFISLISRFNFRALNLQVTICWSISFSVGVGWGESRLDLKNQVD